MTNSFTEEDVGSLLNLIEDVKQEGACRGVSAVKAIERLRVAWEYWQTSVKVIRHTLNAAYYGKVA
jgi:hypothetical protein